MKKLIKAIPTGVSGVEFWSVEEPFTVEDLVDLEVTADPAAFGMPHKSFNGLAFPEGYRKSASCKIPLGLLAPYFSSVGEAVRAVLINYVKYLERGALGQLLQDGLLPESTYCSLSFDYRGCRTVESHEKKAAAKLKEASEVLDEGKLVQDLVDRANDIVEKVVIYHNNRAKLDWSNSLASEDAVVKFVDKRLLNAERHTVKEVDQFQDLRYQASTLAKQIEELKQRYSLVGEELKQLRILGFSQFLRESIFDDDGNPLVPEDWLDGLFKNMRHGQVFNPAKDGLFWGI